MKYSEFTKLMEGRGFDVVSKHGYLIVKHGGDVLVNVSKQYRYSLVLSIYKYEGMPAPWIKFIFERSTELASTPLEEREDEKRYRLKLPFVSEHNCLSQVRHEKQLTINNKFESNAYKAIFTESEIAELREKHNLDSFEKEEVEDE